MKMVHRCIECGQSFKNNSSFNAHECVTSIENLPMDELLRRYEEQRKLPRSTTTKQ